ncbi:hypothetical protein [Bradyrhizobium diazoefficiens]|uniref:Uncharacterized protein n=1 Tax=Bradyrhizobium diazoefficiens TaxID=1355477 RepID=A0A810CST7_9BRAD|nr:hypothetical protein XF1B_51790 [Bradyrhizobium diazoefficiens]BCE48762.1 hypothetical protein XF4B_51110 [Bradyrhizobium diazoefficiens]BCE92277.1 hypothetical protein XF10B_50750 [Bradyrhizobium diazoefficiens]BCF27205.1 hypothetical protein XF14B_51570 [Bradyrhizobium diazoefficiens]
MDFLEKNWALIAANPIPFIAAAILVGGFVWAYASIHFSSQIANAKGQAELAEKQRDDFKNKLAVSTPDEAKTKLDRLEGELKGLNKIISVTIGYPWAPLAGRQIDDLAAALAKLEKHRVQIMYANQLGKDLAQTLFQAFQKAGWEGATFSDGGGAHLGIIAGAGAKKAALLKQAIETTTRLHVELDKPTVPEYGDLVYLFVGTNANENP